jgi:hypothetical protein
LEVDTSTENTRQQNDAFWLWKRHDAGSNALKQRKNKDKRRRHLIALPPKNKIACLNKRKAQASNADLVSNCVLLLEFKRLIQENKN